MKILREMFTERVGAKSQKREFNIKLAFLPVSAPLNHIPNTRCLSALCIQKCKHTYLQNKVNTIKTC